MLRPTVFLPGSWPTFGPSRSAEFAPLYSTEVESANGFDGNRPQDPKALERPHGVSVRRGPCMCPEPSATVHLETVTLDENVCCHRVC